MIDNIYPSGLLAFSDKSSESNKGREPAKHVQVCCRGVLQGWRDLQSELEAAEYHTYADASTVRAAGDGFG